MEINCMNISNRFAQFLIWKCRTINTGQRFLGPEWARLAINQVLELNGELPYLDPRFRLII